LHSLKGTASWRWKGLFLLADLQIYSERFVTRDEGQAIPPYTLANITAGYRHSLKSFTLEGRCSINNLADQYYEEVVYRPMPGRNYLFSLIINWNHEKQNATDL
jgi:iron complex outermembrane receptor protein